MKKEIAIPTAIALLITFSVGFCDGYTVLCRGGIFSFMHTGNLIRFCLALGDGRFDFSFFIPICVFIVSCALSFLVYKKKYTPHIVVGYTLSMYVLAAFLPDTENMNILIASLLSVSGAMLVQVFRRAASIDFTSTMFTNNMRLMAGSFAAKEFKKGLFYFFVVLSFALGVVSSALLGKAMGLYAIAPAASLYLIVLILLFVPLKRETETKEENL